MKDDAKKRKIVAKAFVSGGQTEDSYTAMRYLVDAIRRSVNLCIPAVVVAYDRVTRMAEVMPLVKNAVIDENDEAKNVEGETFFVPVHFPCFGKAGSGGFAIDMPLFVGDRGVVIAPDVDTTSLRHKTKQSGLQKEDADYDEIFWHKVVTMLSSEKKESDTGFTSAREGDYPEGYVPQRPHSLERHRFEHGFFIPHTEHAFDVTRVFNSSAPSVKNKREIEKNLQEAAKEEFDGEDDIPTFKAGTVGNDELYIGETSAKKDKTSGNETPGENDFIDDLASLTLGKRKIAVSVGSGANVLMEDKNTTNDASEEQPSITFSAGKSDEEGDGKKNGCRARIYLIGSVNEEDVSRVILEVGKVAGKCACVVLEGDKKDRGPEVRILVGKVTESPDGERSVVSSGTEVVMRPDYLLVKKGASRFEMGAYDVDGKELMGFKINVGSTKLEFSKGDAKIAAGGSSIEYTRKENLLNINAPSLALPDRRWVWGYGRNPLLGSMAFM